MPSSIFNIRRAALVLRLADHPNSCVLDRTMTSLDCGPHARHDTATRPVSGHAYTSIEVKLSSRSSVILSPITFATTCCVCRFIFPPAGLRKTMFVTRFQFICAYSLCAPCHRMHPSDPSLIPQLSHSTGHRCVCPGVSHQSVHTRCKRFPCKFRVALLAIPQRRGPRERSRCKRDSTRLGIRPLRARGRQRSHAAAKCTLGELKRPSPRLGGRCSRGQCGMNASLYGNSASPNMLLRSVHHSRVR